jgi:hypothetical protein
MCSTDCSASCEAPPPLASPSSKFMLHKDGSPKDANATLIFMRRSAKIREELRATSSDNATERVRSSDNATERAALDEDEVSV